MTDDDDKIDFSALDPARDAGAWNRRADAVAARAAERLAAGRFIGAQLDAWRWRAVTLSVGLAACAWACALVLGPAHGTSRPDARAAVLVWAARDETPPAATVLAALGGRP